MFQVQNIREHDYNTIIAVLNDWWGGRQMSDMLPKLFFIHFQPSSFIVEVNGEIIAFLIGFLSQTFPGEAYIHFVGVHPDKRTSGIGRDLYHHFFKTVKQNGCHTVRCITSPVNKASISFHTRLGFHIEKGDKIMNGIDVSSNYDGMGNDRVLFVKEI